MCVAVNLAISDKCHTYKRIHPSNQHDSEHNYIDKCSSSETERNRPISSARNLISLFLAFWSRSLFANILRSLMHIHEIDTLAVGCCCCRFPPPRHIAVRFRIHFFCFSRVDFRRLPPQPQDFCFERLWIAHSFNRPARNVAT